LRLFSNLRDDLHSAGTATNHVGPNSALNYRFSCLNLSKALILSGYDTVGDNFLFADMHLGFLLSSQGRSETSDFIIFQGTLSLTSADSQLVKLHNEIFGLNSKLLSQQMDSRFSHLLLPVSLRQFSNQFFFCVLADFRMKRSMETLSPQKSLPTRKSRVQISSSGVG
jgi:hypothetical protein